MEKMREEFEAWAKSAGHLALKEDDGDYSFQHMRYAWESWKASRSTLCVELPEREIAGKYANDFEDGHESGFNDALSDCKVALKKSGVSYK